MYEIGLTGGIASGKSTISNHLIELGYPLIDADKVAREVVEPGTEGLEAIRKTFGDDVIHPDGSLNREALGKIVFNDESKRLVLNECLHGLIRKRIYELAELYKQKGSPVVFYDIPLLIEGKWYESMDEVWLVYVNKDTQIKRLMNRNHYSKEEALSRITSQMPLDDKQKYATRIIDNNGSMASSLQQVDELLQTLASKLK